jgi:hypothetical protein
MWKTLFEVECQEKQLWKPKLDVAVKYKGLSQIPTVSLVIILVWYPQKKVGRGVHESVTKGVPRA